MGGGVGSAATEDGSYRTLVIITSVLSKGGKSERFAGRK